MASRTSSPLLHPDEPEFDLFAVMSALTDPVRLTIVLQLSAGPGIACGTFHVSLAKSALSRHLRVLREAGVIRQQDNGTQRINTLRKEELNRRFPGLLDLVLTEGAERLAARPAPVQPAIAAEFG
ncbi:ArsR family transcriptional regulator [Streptomyces sp. 846.5]|nr:ArsR family transcriptional regulator [Streptomyces sp. 846.5]TDT98075.1 ArsR family transcriptional regulator [Streptomyces sp. 846.5]